MAHIWIPLSPSMKAIQAKLDAKVQLARTPRTHKQVASNDPRSIAAPMYELAFSGNGDEEEMAVQANLINFETGYFVCPAARAGR